MCEFSFFEELKSLETNNASRWQIKQCGLLDEQQLVIILQDASSFHQAQRYNDGFGTALIRPGLLSRGTRLRGQHVEVTLKNNRSQTINPTDFSFKVIQGNNLFQALDSKSSEIFSVPVQFVLWRQQSQTWSIDFFGSDALKWFFYTKWRELLTMFTLMF